MHDRWLRRRRRSGKELILTPESKLADVVPCLGIRMQGLVKDRIDASEGAEEDDTNEQAAETGPSQTHNRLACH